MYVSGLHLFLWSPGIDFTFAQGELTFEGDASFLGCFSETDSSVETSRGGAISNNAPGIIHFMGDLTMEDNDADVSAKSEDLPCDTIFQVSILYSIRYLHPFLE